MTAAIVHRGPDGEGYFIDGCIGLGHRRLSIIDIEGGAQPMSTDDQFLHLVFNGEIYNYIELRHELKSLGYRFHTQSDTEVILHAYAQWGKECTLHLNGIFAFAIWDKQNGALFIARDHLGIKPLYYALLGDRIIFASEIKALLQVVDCPRDIDLNSLADLFTFRYVPSPRTLFRGICKLPPGHFMFATDKGLQLERYWNSVPVQRKHWREEDLIEEYQTLLEDTITMQLRSDVPLGLYLSSGVDSGALLAIMSEHSSRPVETFTIGFEDGEKTNEISDARKTAQRFGASHRSEILSCSDYMDYFERYMGDLEEPVAHEAAPAFFFLANMTSSRVKVALTGQGADEPWAGYDRHIGVKLSSFYSRLPKVITADLAALLAKAPIPMERLKRGVASLAEPDMAIRFAKVYSFFSEEMKAQLFRGALKENYDHTSTRGLAKLRKLQGEVQHLDPLSQMLYIDTRTNLPDDLLMVADKTSMANSLEVRVPFLDYRLVEFVESLPPELKLNRMTGKYLHKKALRKWLPKETVYRKKKGFSHPIAKWLKGPMKPMVEDCLLSENSVVSRYFDQNYIASLVQAHQQGREQHLRHIYLLLSFELWHRNFLSR